LKDSLLIGGFAGLLLGTVLYTSRPGSLLSNRGVDAALVGATHTAVVLHSEQRARSVPAVGARMPHRRVNATTFTI
jgi:hypothetical protein